MMMMHIPVFVEMVMCCLVVISEDYLVARRCARQFVLATEFLDAVSVKPCMMQPV
jgi:hypothetical protein